MGTVLEVEGASLPRLTQEQVEAAVVGELTVIHQGRKLPLKLRKEEREAFEQAKEDGFVVVRRRRVHLPFVHGAWCDALSVASVKVEVRRVYAAVQLHMVTASGRRLSVQDQEAVMAGFARYMEDDAWCSVGELFCACDKVRTDKARVLARELVLIARRAGRAKASAEVLDGDALERAKVLGYLVCSAQGAEAESQEADYRMWCLRTQRPTLVIAPDPSGETWSLTLRPSPSLKGRALTVEQARRALVCVLHHSPRHLSAILEHADSDTHGHSLNDQALRIARLPLRDACKLAAAMLASLGFAVEGEADI